MEKLTEISKELRGLAESGLPSSTSDTIKLYDKVNEIIDVVNKQELAIRYLASAVESGEWLDIYKDIYKILHPEEKE